MPTLHRHPRPRAGHQERSRRQYNDLPPPSPSSRRHVRGQPFPRRRRWSGKTAGAQRGDPSQSYRSITTTTATTTRRILLTRKAGIRRRAAHHCGPFSQSTIRTCHCPSKTTTLRRPARLTSPRRSSVVACTRLPLRHVPNPLRIIIIKVSTSTSSNKDATDSHPSAAPAAREACQLHQRRENGRRHGSTRCGPRSQR